MTARTARKRCAEQSECSPGNAGHLLAPLLATTSLAACPVRLPSRVLFTDERLECSLPPSFPLWASLRGISTGLCSPPWVKLEAFCVAQIRLTGEKRPLLTVSGGPAVSHTRPQRFETELKHGGRFRGSGPRPAAFSSSGTTSSTRWKPPNRFARSRETAP